MPRPLFPIQITVSEQMRRKGVEHHEPVSVSVVEFLPEFNACQEKIEGTWYQFFQKFQGYDDEITLYFTQGFDGKVVYIGNFIMIVSKKKIVHATALPYRGEHWFKNKTIEHAV